jgi:hypothetical protein
MIRRLEQVAALVVAAGLALVSYGLFFSWARGGGAEHRLPSRRTGVLALPAVPVAVSPFGRHRVPSPLSGPTDGFRDRLAP